MQGTLSTLTVKINGQVKRRAKAKAIMQGRALSKIIEELLCQWLDEDQSQDPGALIESEGKGGED